MSGYELHLNYSHSYKIFNKSFFFVLGNFQIKCYFDYVKIFTKNSSPVKLNMSITQDPFNRF